MDWRSGDSPKQNGRKSTNKHQYWGQYLLHKGEALRQLTNYADSITHGQMRVADDKGRFDVLDKTKTATVMIVFKGNVY